MKRHIALALGILGVLPAMSAPANPAQEGPPAPSQAGPPVPSQPTTAEHVVNPGDSLEKIARHHGCRLAELMNANGLKADSVIFPGQKLKIPTAQPPQTAKPAAQAESTPSELATHKVAPGETFAAIARQHGIPLDKLLAANPDIKPTALRPGQTILLGETATIAKISSLDEGNTQMILATKQDAPTQAPSSRSPLVSPPAVKIQSIRIDREMTYLEFASRQGTNTRRLNQLNGLDLLDSALLAKGSELLAPAQP